MIREDIKAFPESEKFCLSDPIPDASKVGKALLAGKTVVGIFHPEEYPQAMLFHIYKIRNDILFHLIMLPNRDLHLETMQVGPDDFYKTIAAQSIMVANESVHIDVRALIDISKAHVIESPNAAEVRELLRA